MPQQPETDASAQIEYWTPLPYLAITMIHCKFWQLSDLDILAINQMFKIQMILEWTRLKT